MGRGARAGLGVVYLVTRGAMVVQGLPREGLVLLKPSTLTALTTTPPKEGSDDTCEEDAQEESHPPERRDV